MATYTKNYELTKPDAATEYYDINVQNENMNKIDAALEPTADPEQIPASNGPGKLQLWISWIANRIKAITGKTNWYDAPATTLEAAKSHLDGVAPHSGHETPTGAQAKATAAETAARTYADTKETPSGAQAKVNTAMTNHINTTDPHSQYAMDTDVSAMQNALSAHTADYVRQAGYGTATGTNALAITLNPVPTAYVDGMALSFKNTTQNTGAVTINVNGLGAKSVLKSNGLALASGNLKANSVYTIRYNGTNFILQGEGGDVEYDFGTGVDGSLSTTGDETIPNNIDGAIVVLNYNNLTINAGHTFTLANRGKGLLINVQGDLRIDGVLHMDGKGPSTTDITSFGINHVLKSISGEVNLFGITATDLGGNGGNGGVGTNGSGSPSTYTPGGSGSSSHAYGGGYGGGGGRGTNSTSDLSPAGSTPRGKTAQSVGGTPSGVYTSCGGGGGSHSNGGGAGPSGQPGQPGQGPGGLIIIKVKGNITGSGIISANGLNGGAGGQSTISNMSYGGGGGGGAGGGAVIIICAGIDSFAGTISVAGGMGGQAGKCIDDEGLKMYISSAGTSGTIGTIKRLKIKESVT